MTPLSVRTALGSLVVLLVAGAFAPVRAADGLSFVIAPRDGYGISECLEKTGECGKVIADAWCESHGLSKALSYGHVEDVTGTIPKAVASQIAVTGAKAAAALTASNGKIEPGSYVITCQP